MIHRDLNRIALTGFLLIFCSTLGSLVVLVMPVLNTVQKPLLLFVMLPAGIVGVAMIVFEKMQTPTDA
jgi:hypothetical protein